MQKPKSFRPWQPDQTTLLPPSPREWLAEDHQVYFLLDLVDELDLSEILIPAQSKDPRGEKGFDPACVPCSGVIPLGLSPGVAGAERPHLKLSAQRLGR